MICNLRLDIDILSKNHRSGTSICRTATSNSTAFGSVANTDTRAGEYRDLPAQASIHGSYYNPTNSTPVLRP